MSPVLLPAMFVRDANNGQEYGALMDGCSTDNYVTNEAAKKHKLQPVHEVNLEVEGMCGEVTNVESKVFLVSVEDIKIKVQSGIFLCSGI